jgi:hypothetical protein
MMRIIKVLALAFAIGAGIGLWAARSGVEPPWRRWRPGGDAPGHAGGSGPVGPSADDPRAGDPHDLSAA